MDPKNTSKLGPEDPFYLATIDEASMSKESKDSREFVCGFGAAFINICCTFPINKVIFRQMAHGIKTNSALLQMRKEGFYFLYRGLLPPLLQKTFSVSLMFGTFNQYQKLFDAHFPKLAASSGLKLTMSAFLAGCTEAVLTPFERVQTLLQDPKYNHQFTNTFHTFKEIRKFGIKEYYRGLTPILLRNGPSNVLFFSLRGQLKDVFPPTKLWWTELVVNFASGAFVGAFISTIFYPVNVIKTKMQTNPAGSGFISMTTAARQVYQDRQRSVRKLFFGVHLNYTRSFISWGIINASYEMLSKMLY